MQGKQLFKRGKFIMLLAWRRGNAIVGLLFINGICIDSQIVLQDETLNFDSSQTKLHMFEFSKKLVYDRGYECYLNSSFDYALYCNKNI